MIIDNDKDIDYVVDAKQKRSEKCSGNTVAQQNSALKVLEIRDGQENCKNYQKRKQTDHPADTEECDDSFRRNPL